MSLPEGVVLFRRRIFKGEAKFVQGCLNIPEFAPNVGKSLSSFIVTGGTWRLYSEPNKGGFTIDIEGRTEFPPGYYDFKEDKVKDNTVQCIVRV